MKKAVAAFVLILPLAACSETHQGAALGGAGGAAVGAAVAGSGNRVGGALIGGAIGATAGALIGHASERGQCRYRDSYGREYTAACPNGY